MKFMGFLMSIILSPAVAFVAMIAGVILVEGKDFIRGRLRKLHRRWKNRNRGIYK